MSCFLLSRVGPPGSRAGWNSALAGAAGQHNLDDGTTRGVLEAMAAMADEFFRRPVTRTAVAQRHPLTQGVELWCDMSAAGRTRPSVWVVPSLRGRARRDIDGGSRRGPAGTTTTTT
jgi:hypothetical protein